MTECTGPRQHAVDDRAQGVTGWHGRPVIRDNRMHMAMVADQRGHPAGANCGVLASVALR